MAKKNENSPELVMLACAKALHESMLKVDTEGAIACITMLITNYCRTTGSNPLVVSKIIHEAIEEHIDEIREGKL